MSDTLKHKVGHAGTTPSSDGSGIHEIGLKQVLKHKEVA